jgi:hypothetical protein
MRKIFVFLACTIVCGVLYAEPGNNDSDIRNVIDSLTTLEKYFDSLSVSEKQEAVVILRSAIARLYLVLGENPREKSFFLLSTLAFEKLLQTVSETPETRKTEKILTIGKKARITCEQLKKLVELYSWENMKVELIKAIFPQVIDPQNMVIVTPLLTRTDRQDIESWLSNQ